MRLFHLSDLHIGKQLNGWNLAENQEAVLNQTAAYAKEYRPDAILICGDIYDRSVPSGEAFSQFGRFLEKLSDLEIPVLIIAGNHDSPDRLGFAGPLLEKGNIFISSFPPSQKMERLKQVTLSDQWGEVNFFLFPFMKPGYVRRLLEEEGMITEEEGQALTYDRAFHLMLGREKIDTSKRNIILCHQFFTDSRKEPETCDSETAVLMTGGLDQIDASVLSPFDYAALGHLHGCQKVGSSRIRYCGTPYKYSVSEEHHKKAVLMAEIGEKGEEPVLSFLPLTGIQDVRRERGKLADILKQAKEPFCHDFVSIVLTDEREPADFREQLKERYDHILEIRFDNDRTRRRLEENRGGEDAELTPMEAFRQFFSLIQNSDLTEEEEALMEQITEEAKEEEE